MTSHPLKSLLQLQLASDASSVLHLSSVLSTLSEGLLLPSPHLQKWTSRVTSLIHSKDAGARWAGMCIAYRTSSLSKSTMTEFAQTWAGLALSILTKPEPLPLLKASIRYLRHVLSAATDMPELQRQVATPTVPKFSQVLVSIVEKAADYELKALAMDTLKDMVILYPSLNRALSSSITSMCHKILNGSAPQRTNKLLLHNAAGLYAVLHYTGGKVGAANLWKKSVDETIQCLWSASMGLRTTFPAKNNPPPSSGLTCEDPALTVALNVDRLQCSVAALCSLLRTTVQRPVHVPIGRIMEFCLFLSACTADEEKEGHVDATVRALELAIVPELQTSACDLLCCLAKTVQRRLTPYVSRLVVMITYHLEQNPLSERRCALLRCIQTLLSNSSPTTSELSSTRLVKAVMLSLMPLLSTQSDVHTGETSSEQSKKGRKRRRDYEGDEVFKLSKDVVCSSIAEGEAILCALDSLQVIMRGAELQSAIRSLACRVMLSLSLSLTAMSRSSLSQDVHLHSLVLAKVNGICLELARGTTSAMSRSLGLVLRSTVTQGNEHTMQTRLQLQQEVDLLLHPRGPPLVRPLPHVEALSLFRAEESNEELTARKSLALATINDGNIMDVVADPIMMTSTPESTQPVSTHLPIPTPKITPLASISMSSPMPTSQKMTSSITTAPTKDSADIPSAISSRQPVNSLLQPSSSQMELAPLMVEPRFIPMMVDDDEEEEGIPTIDVESDSDG
ncbi:rRNA processing/ribosome biogenesis-domain-containing protein [Suillus bovinus]|uniref:rRNA processing/ribosome biogenesis-domain-containing protein n=1 Tax=Suillus bovinus TaxID=48563 RepID=UPI001B86BB2F|nr:rRNA processing/ribosome biogenesis-domain-containing protein [Suillus bovinus]KAG2154981.1 rRNA processing/ribosome biogenesis-domain-containing protein [Suillus bovinus]